jgi:aldose 1-epimerase
MNGISRAVRRPLALAALGGLAAVLAMGGAALAIAAPASHHGHGKAQPGHKRHTGKTPASHAGHPAPGGSHGGPGMQITSAPWGTADGQAVDLFTLRNSNGMTVKISNYGGVVQSIWVPDRRGHLTNVALGFPTLSDYVNDFTQGATSTPWPLSGGSGDTYFGAIIGRYANRIANASFDLNNTTYKLDANNGTNTLHGGYLGWNTKVWAPSTSTGRNSVALHLTADMPAGEGCLPSLSPGCTGFPAAVTATVTYRLTRDNQLQIRYKATNQSSNLATVINLTNHTYFNLAGEGSGDVYHQLLALNSDRYTPSNTNLIPEAPYFVPVGGTPFDFRTMHPIGQYIRATNLPDGTTGPLKQLQIAHGYDHNWVLNGNGSYRLVAVGQDPGDGVTLWTYTDQPGVQLYTGNFLVGDLIGTGGTAYRQGDAFTLETQHYPDTPHHIGEAGWPSVVLNPGATFKSKTAYKFGVQGGRFQSRVHFP